MSRDRPEHRTALHRACAERGLQLIALYPSLHSLGLLVSNGPAGFWRVDATAPEDLAGEDLEEALLQDAGAQLDKLVRQLGEVAAKTTL